MSGLTNDPQIEPITKLDMLYYQANVRIQQGDLETSNALMVEAVMLAKNLGSWILLLAFC